MAMEVRGWEWQWGLGDGAGGLRVLRMGYGTWNMGCDMGNEFGMIGVKWS